MSLKIILISGGSAVPKALRATAGDFVQYHTNEAPGCVVNFTAGSPFVSGDTTINVPHGQPCPAQTVNGTAGTSYPYQVTVAGMLATAAPEDGPVIIVDP